MPNRNDPSQIPLRDIHLPADVSWWPPALGWWILLGVIILIIAIVFIRKTSLRKKKLQKSSLQAFYRIKVDYHLNKDTHKTIEDLSVLLRRIALSYYGRETIASLSGEQWLKKLDQLSQQKTVTFLNTTGRSLITAPYQKKPDVNTSELFTLIEQWIKALPANKLEFSKAQSK